MKIVLPLLSTVLAVSAGATALAAVGSDDVSVRVEALPGIHGKWVDPLLAEPVPVTIFGGTTLDVRQIDPARLVLAGAAAMKNADGTLGTYGDVDGDGLVDLTVRFSSKLLRLDERSHEAQLSGWTKDGRAIRGAAAVATLESARAERRRAAHTGWPDEKLPPVVVEIEVLPGQSDKEIELGNRGTVSVAVLSAPGFDATRLDPTSLHLAAAPVTRRKTGGLASFEDVNRDGRADLVVEVPKKLLRLDAGSTEVVLTGFTPEGRFLTGSAAILIAPTALMTFESDDPVQPTEPNSTQELWLEPIIINDAAPASPYPSLMYVGGVNGVVSKVRVTLKGLTHSFPNDIDVLLVGPTGQSIVLMSDVGGGHPGATNVTLTFDDDAALALDPSVPLATGSYRPTNSATGDTFPADAPTPSAVSGLQAFHSTNPNGAWTLYVVDDASGDVGEIRGGWALDFVIATQFCTAGPITINDNARATPYPSTIAVSGLQGVVQRVTAVVKGLTHTAPHNIDMMLVSPAGSPSMLMSDVGGPFGVTNGTFLLDDYGPYAISTIGFTNGTHRPEDLSPGEVMPTPAHAGPYPVGFNTFRGSSPNGNWSLFIADDQAGGSGSLTQFCIDITTMTPVAHANQAHLTVPAGAPGTSSGPASLYPVTFDVLGVIGTIQSMTVTTGAIHHTFPRDLDVLMEAPMGKVLLMSDVGGGSPGIAGPAYTFDDAAAGTIPVGTNTPGGVFRPSNDDSEGPDTFPAPAPAGPYPVTLSGLNGYSPNGSWKLWVYDDAGGDVGDIYGGWYISLRTLLVPYGACINPSMTIPSGAPGTSSGPASVYSSDAVVLTNPANLTQYKVQVELLGLTHSYPRDLDVLLVGPQGHKVMLMSDAGGSGPGVSNVNLTFDQDAPAPLEFGTNPVSGLYKPTDNEPGDVLPAPAPAGPYATSLTVFEGTNPLGIWKLYVSDDASGDVGSLFGWCVRFQPIVNAGVVSGLQWAHRNTLLWDAGPNATSYNLYRGDRASLESLADGATDSCRHSSSGVFPQGSPMPEVPPAGTFYWYLVRGVNAQGEGPPGFARFGTQARARVHNSSGSCP